jgi:hypothetical protein
MRLARSAGLAAVLGACLLIPAAATGFNGTVLRGLGTATIDGVAAPGEWNPAGAVNFSVRRAAQHGGGTVPATVYAMNDATNLYIALKVDNATVAASTAEISFDGDHDDNAFEDGEDRIAVDSLGFFHDRFYRQGSDAYDIDHSGTNDGDERDGDGPGYSFYEFSHPLDSADNAHDFSLRAGIPTTVSPLRHRCFVRSDFDVPGVPVRRDRDRVGEPDPSRHSVHGRTARGVVGRELDANLRVHGERRRRPAHAADFRVQARPRRVAGVHEPRRDRG